MQNVEEERAGREETWTPVLACEVRHVKIARSSLRNHDYFLTRQKKKDDFQVIIIIDFLVVQSQVLLHFLVKIVLNCNHLVSNCDGRPLPLGESSLSLA